MDTQTVINVLLGLTAFFGGVWVRGLSESLKELRTADMLLADRVQGIELLVAGQYAKREEFKELSSAIFARLDRIEQKIDNKQDKQN